MATNTPPNISARIFYGLRTDIEQNAHYVTDSEIIYPAGGVIVIHNHIQKKQKFIRLQDKHKPIKSIILAPNRRWLALNEIAEEGQKPIITIYDLTTYKRRKILTVPFENSTAREFACVQFTFDSKYLVAITGEPDWYLYYYNWDKGKVESHAKAQNPSGQGTVESVQCNPSDATLVVITGPYTFRIMNVAETVWRQWGWCKAENINITTCMWLTPDRIMFGTANGVIMMVENGELRQNCIFQALDVTEMSLKKVDVEAAEGEKTSTSTGDGTSSEQGILEAESYPVEHFTNFSKGFAYACGQGYVHMFEKETPHHWRKRNVYRIWKKSYKHTREHPLWSPLDAIQHITIDPNQETLLITTLRKQLYYVKLFGQHMLQNPEIAFLELGPAMHYGRINSLSMCAWKPIFMTSGEEDKSIRVWNYMTDDVELIKLYQEEIHCVSLHPTGLFAIVGFSDKLRFMVVLIDDFEVMREFPIRNCKRARFSTNGHLFAAVNGQIIQVFSSVSFQNVYNLKGHNGKITSLAWSANDLTLVSCGTEGAVYEWNMSSGQRVGEVILKTNQFNACAVNSNGKTTYGVGTDGEIKEIGSNSIRRNLGLIGCALDTIVLSRSDLMLFITGGEGGVAAVQLPLLDKAIFNEFHMHNKKVIGIALSYDDQTLVSVAEDSSICIWRLTNADGRAIALDKDFAYSKEILISKKDLKEKINSINLLSTRMSELETEHTYQLRQAEATQAEKLKEVHEGYCAAIEELKEKNEQMENEHTHEIGMIQQDIAKLRSGHERTLQALEADFNIRLISEYDRYQSLEDKTARMRKEYEQRLEDLAESKRQALRQLNDMFEAKLEEKDILLQELQEQAEMEKREHETIKSSIEEDADREIIEIRTAYEVQLKEEKDANVRLKGETGLMKKKLISAHKEIDEFKHQVSQLKAEHKQFQKVISTLERDVTDLKKEISERDGTIQDKEKRIYELKRKKQELEKYKFVLNFKITELKNQIEPKERAIRELKVQIDDMENEELKLLNIKHELELKINQLNEKLSSAKKDFLHEANRNLTLKNTLKKIKIDLHNMTANFQDPTQLKLSVKALFQKYVEDIDFLRSRVAEDEAIREFNRQREHLEKQVAGLKGQLAKSLGGSKSDIRKIMDENCTLLGEINNLRVELKSTRTRCFQMESILGLSARYIPPTTARAKLKHVTEDREKLDEQFKQKIEEREEIIVALKEENERLLGKVRCLDEEATGISLPQFNTGYSTTRHSNIEYAPTQDDNTDDARTEDHPGDPIP
ncbi:cilia- and flagella-associated protein 57 isoform X2 [Maniola jurtina]|uniref:cilia- and flagella-associated protein 57 isoform X2 n=1 Tax=Maniola jurtina TaxID=191418 RepID=UPI001E68E4DE|nr:cilia- and flagella-associated protein 57 isoform X2 [Maniola jurtina]